MATHFAYRISAAGQLATEADDDDIHHWFYAASRLYDNLCENWLDVDAVGVGLDDIEQVRRLASIE